ncbi:MAG: hypothetical protein IJ054_05245 [Lachnospiraceae bacterium]|nr:hypothetical protein [Lachnospiraceae bacterium]MBQ9233765.1 hypothetical protein [Lachnospiraceae bacterium]
MNVLIVLVVASVFIVFVGARIISGINSKKAIDLMKQNTEKMINMTNRVDFLNKNMINLMRFNQDYEKVQLMDGYIKEYYKYINAFQIEYKNWRDSIEEARYNLSGLATSQNLVGGANDLFAIFYYARKKKYDDVLNAYHYYKKPEFNLNVLANSEIYAYGRTNIKLQ